MDPVNPVELWVRLVETQASEIGVTVVMHGVVITGVMTPYERFARWTQEVFQRAAHSGGRFGLPNAEMLPPTPDEVERIRAEWKAREDEVRSAEGLGPDDEVDLDLDLSYFCLRDALVRAGHPDTWFTVPYLLLRTTSVDAFFPGKAG
jgi:hypothetical protein